jgi:WD40 repeat protein
VYVVFVLLLYKRLILFALRWDMNTTNEIITLVGHSRSVRCLHVDGTNEVRLVSGSNDHTIKVI